jgi:hypothetical protein
MVWMVMLPAMMARMTPVSISFPVKERMTTAITARQSRKKMASLPCRKGGTALLKYFN